jgi:pyruvate dehydrogenase E1 component alpha subunit
MNMAVVIKAPIIFVIENNGYSEHTGVSYSVGGADISKRTESFGIKTLRVDGCDYFAVYDAMAELLDYVRSGKGPCAIECLTTRFFGHYEGDPQNYRAKDEVKNHRENMDCLKNFRESVKGKLKKAKLDAIDTEVLALIEDSVQTAKAGKGASPDKELMTDIYVSYA